ncbi:hypothetical protein [Niveispirillum cyanobacteriorum]|uniref:DUF4376 domain-containing protein n=1 Tax=Niveispirillum cyanobacteriorum TaxID=1612173 RepID=UPI00131A426D|nr:hypothetical protein [Niveispirillum cyanobacteriorum]
MPLPDGVSIGWTYNPDRAQPFQRPAREPTTDEKIASIDARCAQVLARGAPYGDRRIAIHDTGRTDLGGMATTAIAALAGALSWPENYALGWIAMDNTRVPLPTPADGLAVADAAARYYAAARQRARDLKDQALAAADAAALNAIDINSGWPEA